MPRTGSTQGIKLRISPPISAIITTCQKGSAALSGVCAGAAPMVCVLSWAIAPSANTRVSDLLRKSGAFSPQLSVTGTVACNLSPSTRRRGFAKSTSSMVSR
ncbi:Uncharacterised protein [Salmonella enterica subsp. enterica serovar Bovismorbificans]|uniref:Uncharacterized protein n=1 Tax=Salmonella enterica subsp. enterica serovar Bovismorbificans TaxID=58097 RepID=A0A655DN25_SALET|nr:Uncharacterised protein [Salmonella enterica subsp. enterica serovar Bovismorbificans]